MHTSALLRALLRPSKGQRWRILLLLMLLTSARDNPQPRARIHGHSIADPASARTENESPNRYSGELVREDFGEAGSRIAKWILLRCTALHRRATRDAKPQVSANGNNADHTRCLLHAPKSPPKYKGQTRPIAKEICECFIN